MGSTLKISQGGALTIEALAQAQEMIEVPRQMGHYYTHFDKLVGGGLWVLIWFLVSILLTV